MAVSWATVSGGKVPVSDWVGGRPTLLEDMTHVADPSARSTLMMVRRSVPALPVSARCSTTISSP
jgi:hypothetical protein